MSWADEYAADYQLYLDEKKAKRKKKPMGGFLGLGNSSAKTDRGNQLAGVNAEWNIYNRGLPLGDKQVDAGTTTEGIGVSGLDAVKQYWKDMMGGGPAAMKAASPALSAINTQADAKRVETAEMGTSRGGGTNADAQQAETERMAQANDVISKVQPMAAQGLESVSTAQVGAGGQQLKEAMAALGLSKETADEIVESSIKSRPISMKANAEVRQQWSDFLAAIGL